jgi:hypothetical protein
MRPPSPAAGSRRYDYPRALAVLACPDEGRAAGPRTVLRFRARPCLRRRGRSQRGPRTRPSYRLAHERPCSACLPSTLSPKSSLPAPELQRALPQAFASRREPRRYAVLYPAFEWHGYPPASRRHHGLARSAASASSRSEIAACAARASAATRRRRGTRSRPTRFRGWLQGGAETPNHSLGLARRVTVMRA